MEYAASGICLLSRSAGRLASSVCAGMLGAEHNTAGFKNTVYCTSLTSMVRLPLQLVRLCKWLAHLGMRLSRLISAGESLRGLCRCRDPVTRGSRASQVCQPLRTFLLRDQPWPCAVEGAHEGCMSTLVLAAVAVCAIMAGEAPAGVSAKPEPLVEHKGTLIKYAGGPMNTAFISGTPGVPPFQASASPHQGRLALLHRA